MMAPCLLLLSVPLVEQALKIGQPADPSVVAVKIDALMARHWRDQKIKPAVLCSDADFLRRVSLDLAGRVPTVAEARAFAADRSVDKRAKVVRRLMQGPEYALHLGRVLDEIIQDRFAGERDFLEYLRASVADHKPWDKLFREVLLGPWDGKRQAADRFLVRRLNSLDDLTNDTARVFFGVNVSCAKCHDHPLVHDWKQDHYFGMASFFNRSIGKSGGGKRGSTAISEKPSGEVAFVTTRGERRTAKLMFLSGKILDEPKAKQTANYSRRAELVRVALEEKTFFSKAIVNQLWAFLLGRGLVHPVDQMHSANAPSVPGLLEWLAEDFAAHNYDLDRVVNGIVSSRVYQLSSVAGQEPASASDRDFARAMLRPLTPQQYALSMVVATDDDGLDQTKDPAGRSKKYRELENQAGRLTAPKLLDARGDRFQSSTGEALYLSNHADVQRLLTATKTNLVGRLATTAEADKIVETAVWAVLGRAADAEEKTYLAKWVQGKPDKAKACRQLVWALMTSAEFRFNH